MEVLSRVCVGRERWLEMGLGRGKVAAEIVAEKRSNGNRSKC